MGHVQQLCIAMLVYQRLHGIHQPYQPQEMIFNASAFNAGGGLCIRILAAGGACFLFGKRLIGKLGSFIVMGVPEMDGYYNP